MWGAVTKAKNVYGWFKFIWAVVWGAIGWAGFGPFLTGLAATVVAVVAAFIKALPWPFIVMGGFCMLVGAVYLAMAPLAFKVLIAAREAIKARAEAEAAGATETALPPSKPKKPPVAAHYEPWKHVDELTIREAAFLWKGLEPSVPSNFTSEVSAWIEALMSAVKKGEIEFKPKHSNPRQIEYERQNPDANTVIYRMSLMDFAIKHRYTPEFLTVEE
jgi:hypothetical protein